MTHLLIEPLQQETFSAFGDVIEASGDSERINSDTVSKYGDLAGIDLGRNDGRPAIHYYEANAYTMPMTIRMLERHPLSSQLFMPLNGKPFLIVVAAAGDSLQPADVRAFISNGQQGINYHPGTWHHPVIAVNEATEFLVLDRMGPGENCDEIFFDDDITITVDVSAL